LTVSLTSSKPACNGKGGWSKTKQAQDHCCYQAGRRCAYLVEHQAGRRYACRLKLKYLTWEQVNKSPEYKMIGEHWTRNGNLPWNYCETFNPVFCCRPELRTVENENAHLDS
jgi:hypothetical protein